MNYDKAHNYLFPFIKYLASLAMEKNVPQRSQLKISGIIQHGLSPLQIFVRKRSRSPYQVVKHTFFNRFLWAEVS